MDGCPEIGGPEVGDQEVGGPEVDGPEAVGLDACCPEVHGLEAVGLEACCPEVHGLEAVDPEIDGPEVFGLEACCPEAVGPEVVGPEAGSILESGHSRQHEVPGDVDVSHQLASYQTDQGLGLDGSEASQVFLNPSSRKTDLKLCHSSKVGWGCGSSPALTGPRKNFCCFSRAEDPGGLSPKCRVLSVFFRLPKVKCLAQSETKNRHVPDDLPSESFSHCDATVAADVATDLRSIGLQIDLGRYGDVAVAAVAGGGGDDDTGRHKLGAALCLSGLFLA